MSNRAFRGLTLCVATLVSMPALTGCGAGSVPYEKLQANTKTLLDRARNDPTLPGNSAMFCLERAIYNYNSADIASRWDQALLGVAGVVGAAGITSQAIGAALPEDTNKADKKRAEVVGVASVAAAAGVLAIRTAAGQSEVALAKRTAAARQVDAALNMLAKYALAEDFKEVTSDGFGSCRDADIETFQAFPGAGAGNKLGKQISDAVSNKDEKAKEAKEAKSEAAEKSAGVVTKKKAFEKADQDLQQAVKKREDAGKRGDKAAQTVAATDEKQAQQAKDDAQKAVDKAKDEAAKAETKRTCKETEATEADRKAAMLRSLSALRRAMFFGTNRDVESADGEMKHADEDLKRAREARRTACGE